jgi:hypothetical protein
VSLLGVQRVRQEQVPWNIRVSLPLSHQKAIRSTEPVMPTNKKSDFETDDVKLQTDGGPALEQEDWDELEEGVRPTSIHENGDVRFEEEPDGELPSEDDDNPYQESDAALPDREEERVLQRDPSKEGDRFGEV